MIEKIIKHHHLKAQLHEFFALAICKPRHWNLGIGSGIWTPNLPGWWLRMREPHPQIHETHESRGYLVTLYFHIHKVLGPQNLVNPTQKVTWHFDPVVTWQFINVIFLEPQVLWAQNLAGAGYSVLIMTEICAEGNWLIQVSVYFHPSLSKKYKPNVKQAVEM